jgi:hypothetical protein
VHVRNNGKAVLSSTGEAPLNLGIVIRDINGTLAAPPAKLDFVRTPLPGPLPPGASANIVVSFPVAPTIGGIVVLDAVQEGVSWLSWYGKPVLELGRFSSCARDPKALCTADGARLPGKPSP